MMPAACDTRCAGCTTPSVCRGGGVCLDDAPALVLAIGRQVAAPAIFIQPQLEICLENVSA